MIEEDDSKTIEEITVHIQHVLDKIHHPDISEQMRDSREPVYNRVVRKMDMDSLSLPSKRKRFILYASIASVVVLLIASTSTFAYYKGYRSAAHEEVITNVEMNVPYGVTSHLTLSDGTKVLLNSGSKLSYPVSFKGERHVTLTGEGFFDVAKDAENPFFVHTNNMSVKVTGTRFAFKAYENDIYTTLTLEEGAVSVIPLGYADKNGISLKPNQQIILDNKTMELQRRNVATEEYTSWKNGILTFRNQSIEEIAVILERRFGITIHILSPKIGEEAYSAQFKHDESLEVILEKLSYKRKWKYNKRNGMIEIINRQ